MGKLPNTSPSAWIKWVPQSATSGAPSSWAAPSTNQYSALSDAADTEYDGDDRDEESGEPEGPSREAQEQADRNSARNCARLQLKGLAGAPR